MFDSFFSSKGKSGHSSIQCSLFVQTCANMVCVMLLIGTQYLYCFICFYTAKSSIICQILKCDLFYQMGQKPNAGPGDIAQSVRCLWHKCEDLTSLPRTLVRKTKSQSSWCTFSPSARETETEGSRDHRLSSLCTQNAPSPRETPTKVCSS